MTTRENFNRAKTTLSSGVVKLSTVRKTQWDSLKLGLTELLCVARKHRYLTGLVVVAFVIGFKVEIQFAWHLFTEDKLKFIEVLMKLIG